MPEPRLIRKYVNRRLYDTVESRYVNLEDLHRVINGGGEIRVIDQASGRDITTTVLLQIIGEAEHNKTNLNSDKCTPTRVLRRVSIDRISYT